MDYSRRLTFQGDRQKAFDLAVSTLTGLGFRLETQTTESISLTGPGMNSTRQSPLLGASQLQLRHSVGELSLDAELGGVARIRQFLTIFPIGLSLLLALILSTVFALIFGGWNWLLPVLAVVGVNGLIWLILTPLILRSLTRRTTTALDTLLHNLTQAS